MDEQIVSYVREEMEQKSSEYLLKMHQQHNTVRWSEEAFEAVRRILVDRGAIQENKPVKVSPTTQTGLTKCPFCAGEIENGVLKCKHCGEWLDVEHRKQQEDLINSQKTTGSVAKMIGWLIASSILIGVIARSCN